MSIRLQGLAELTLDNYLDEQTHHVALAAPVAEFVVALDSIGRVASQGSVADALSSVPELAIEATKEHEEMERADKEVDEPDAKAVEDAPEAKKGGLVVAEEKQVGARGIFLFL